MPAFEPNLDLLRQAFGNSIEACQAELIKVALGWSRVYRVTLLRQGHSTRETAIVKTADPAAAPTPLEAVRELRFYQSVHSGLCIPKPQVHFLTTDEASGFHVIVMEDLAVSHRIPVHPHRWSPVELTSVLRTYASLHSATARDLQYEWLAPRHEFAVDLGATPESVACVQRAGIWGDLPGLGVLIEFAEDSIRRYKGTALSLLHGDTTPANAALPDDLEARPATLIDWQDVGTGMAEFDLAYLDLQPFESARGIPRDELLDTYWRYRSEINPDVPPPRERRARQLHADVVHTLWLTATAGRVALRPHPAGTYPHMHWASQYGIVYNRLRTLIEEINSQG